MAYLRILTTLILAGILFGCSPDEQDADGTSGETVIRPVKTAIVERQSERLQRSYSGVVLPAREVELSFRVSGQLNDVAVRAGQQVKEGDTIAQLDTRDFESEVAGIDSQIAQARSQLSSLTSGARREDVTALEAAVRAVQAEVDAARDQLGRTQQLFDRQVAAKAAVEQDQTALNVAIAKLEAEEQALAKGQAGATGDEVAAQEAGIRGLEERRKAVEASLSDTTLKAPFDGIIAFRSVENFANVQAKEPIVRLQTLSRPNVAFDIPAADVPGLAAADLGISVVLDSIPGRAFEAQREEFSTQADAATQTFRGRVSISNEDGATILPGMTGVVSIMAVNEQQGGLILPLAAIASEPDGSAFVWVVSQDNIVSKKPVTIGKVTGGNVEISGVEPETIVVSAGLSALQDGMQVKPVAPAGS